MPMTCRICPREDRPRIDEMLLRGVTLRNIAEQYGTSPPSLLRHKAHLTERVARAIAASQRNGVEAHEAAEIANGNAFAGTLVTLDAQAEGCGLEAAKERDWRTVLLSVRERVRIAELRARISGELRNESLSVNVELPPETAAAMAEIFLARRRALPSQSIPAGSIPAELVK